ncbi:hypothetical protein BCR42DRAFT_408322 [Absidia repens]|uniref:Uncharacterized protein n=1 Tax=Absidia repens TaxID=90262 RepID=A0A1X2IR85_9FUNG|nr:hypothetical protein BCR42DRAFT_408322 [Absidia repens]
MSFHLSPSVKPTEPHAKFVAVKFIKPSIALSPQDDKDNFHRNNIEFMISWFLFIPPFLYIHMIT